MGSFDVSYDTVFKDDVMVYVGEQEESTCNGECIVHLVLASLGLIYCNMRDEYTDMIKFSSTTSVCLKYC